jgi:hypothetical protein
VAVHVPQAPERCADGAEGVGPAGAEEALAEMIDLACELRDYDYVRSEDPVEAAAVVVSDEVEALWRHLLGRHAFEGFVAAAAGQFVRWEVRFGWTRSGWGPVSERERRLSGVLAGVLTVPDTWVTFAERYLEVFDGLVQPPVIPVCGRGRSYQVEQRCRELERQAERRIEVLVACRLASAAPGPLRRHR